MKQKMQIDKRGPGGLLKDNREAMRQKRTYLLVGSRKRLADMSEYKTTDFYFAVNKKLFNRI